jgi:class 3 adenylate cyclase/tetratricopeptide (TPR) repeat protein
MSCAACGTENPSGARFCMACGARLERRCPNCGAPAPAEARFCMSCGDPLDEAHAEVAGVGVPVRLSEERRQVTVLFADLSGYTAVAERMDPEAVKALVDRALMRLGGEVERHGGTVDKYIGDNVMAIFGAPVAHEDDAERAVRAGLGMQSAMDEVNESLPAGVHFDLRVGVNTGEVLAGAVGRNYTVVGDTVNVAARLQSAARPGSVTVGERTMRATSGAVRYEPLEPLELRGKSAPVAAWEAVEVMAEHPVGRAAPARESPLVGRAQEISRLEAIFDRVEREGGPHLVTVVGEAGVGKSRLLRELERRLRERVRPPTVRTGRCLPYGTGIVFWALGEVIRAECGIVNTDSADEAWDKLVQHASTLFAPEGEWMDEPGVRKTALLGRLIGLEVPRDLAPDGEEPERLRESFFSALRAGIEAMARRRPLVIAFEDIHWADNGMLDAIEHLAQWVRAPLMIVCLARGELLDRRPAWGSGRPFATQVPLEPLSADETQALVAALLPDGEAVLPAVVERSGGNPLFAEEMARRLAEEGGVHAAELPDTVQAVLAARLDALDAFERQLVQEAAVAGRTFFESSLATLAGSGGRELERALLSLQEKDILVAAPEGRLPGERELSFKHVLIRDVAYGMLPKAVRARKHFEVGSFVEQRAGDRTDEVVQLLAEHYGRAAVLGIDAGIPQPELDRMQRLAMLFLEQAGDAAGMLYANREAAAHYRHARAVCPNDGQADGVRIGEKLGDMSLRLGRVDEAVTVWLECLEWHRGQEHLERVADLHRRLGSALSHKGEREPAIEHYQKGINLLKGGPPRLELVHLYEEAAWLYLQTGDNMLAIYASEKALRLAELLGEARAASRAHGIFGRVFGRIGDTEKARENLERAVELARGSDRGETIMALWALGRHLEVSEAAVAPAREAYEEALALAEEMGVLPAQIELHASLAQLAAYGADWEQVERSTKASAELAEREGLVGKLGLPTALRGLLRWREGRLDEAAVLFRRAHELAGQTGSSELAFQSLFGLATVLRDGGDLSGASAALDQALDVCERAGLVAQSIQATAQRAVVLALSQRHGAAREAAREATDLAERLHYPIGRAAALEARGVCAADPLEGAALLDQAAQAWTELDRPLEAAHSRLMAGQVLAPAEPERARRTLADAAGEIERLGVHHLSDPARAMALDVSIRGLAPRQPR